MYSGGGDVCVYVYMRVCVCVCVYNAVVWWCVGPCWGDSWV